MLQFFTCCARCTPCRRARAACTDPTLCSLLGETHCCSITQQCLFSLQTWAGGVHWPDFVFNPEADTYWRDLLRSWPNGSQWSGLWLGMNEGEQPRGGAW